MHDIIIRFRIRIVTVAATNEETAVLILVILVSALIPPVIGHKFHIIVRIVEGDIFDVHSIIFVA